MLSSLSRETVEGCKEWLSEFSASGYTSLIKLAVPNLCRLAWSRSHNKSLPAALAVWVIPESLSVNQSINATSNRKSVMFCFSRVLSILCTPRHGCSAATGLRIVKCSCQSDSRVRYTLVFYTGWHNSGRLFPVISSSPVCFSTRKPKDRTNNEFAAPVELGEKLVATVMELTEREPSVPPTRHAWHWHTAQGRTVGESLRAAPAWKKEKGSKRMCTCLTEPV